VVLWLSLAFYDSDVVEVLVGALAGVWVTLIVEALRSPALSIAPRAGGKAMAFRVEDNDGWIVQLHLRNAPLPRWLSFVQREALVEVSGTLTFRDLSGKALAKPMPIRWSNSPQPGHQYVELARSGAELRYVVDHERLVTRWTVPPLPSEDGVFDVAARYRGEDACYGYTNESYFSQFRPPAWRLPIGEYVVDVQISAANGSARQLFKLENRGPDGSWLRLVDLPRKHKRVLLGSGDARAVAHARLGTTHDENARVAAIFKSAARGVLRRKRGRP